MYEPDLEKLRRFALAVGLITLTYSVTGIYLSPGTDISLVGMKFGIARPGLLPIGIVLASVYATARLYYYGFMLKKSPYRIRREILDSLRCLKDSRAGKDKKIPMYFGPTEFETNFADYDPIRIEKYITDFPDVFPKFAGAVHFFQHKQDHVQTMEGKTVTLHGGKVTIPIRCRLAASIQDVDYSLPVWLNVTSLCIFGYRMWMRGISA
jgi:hypothetical protein